MIETTNQMRRKKKKLDFFFERTETTKVMIQEQINFEKYGE
jgi:hypothetical protein